MKKIFIYINIFIYLFCIIFNLFTVNSFAAANEYIFEYTGDIQTFTVPESGKYKLELYGASGGNGAQAGGAGGYTNIEIALKKGQILYIACGGQGGSGNTNGNIGGFNGGGTTASISGGGGGATHIALKSGTLKELRIKDDDQIIAIAGGGGGGAGLSGVTAHNCIFAYSDETGNHTRPGSDTFISCKATNGGGYSAAGSSFSSGNWVSASDYNPITLEGTSQTKGFAKGYGDGGKISGGSGGGWYGGFSSTAGLYMSGSGGNGYTIDTPYEKDSKESNHIGDGFVKITFLGEIYHTIKIDPKNGGTYNGKNSITEISAKFGENFTLNDIITFDGFKFYRYEDKIDGSVINKTFMVPDSDVEIVARYIAPLTLTAKNQENSNYISLNFSQNDTFKKYYKIYQYRTDIGWYDANLSMAADFGTPVKYKTFTTPGNFNYVIPYSGTYKISAYGASGGNAAGYIGGKGAFAQGEIYLERGTNIMVHVGAAGGTHYNADYGGTYVGHGGGSADVRIEGTTLYDRYIVAAGGGGAVKYGGGAHGGNGGALTSSAVGVTYYQGNAGDPYVVPPMIRGSTQYEGSLAYRRDYVNGPVYRQIFGGFGTPYNIGGDGWYGGGISQGCADMYSAGSGGTSFVRGYPGCDNYTMLNNYDKYIFTNTTMTAGVNSGNAKVYIELLDSTDVYDSFKDGVYVKDMAAPNICTNGQILSGNNDNILLKWENTGDNGTSYKHYAESYNADTDEKLSTSNTIDFYKISGIEGYYYYLDTKESGTVNSNNTFINENSVEISYENYTRFMHVAAVDYAGNIGPTYTFKIPVGIVINFNKNDLTINSNGDIITTKATGQMSSQLISYGTSSNLNKNNFKKEGYTFTSWNTKSDGSGESFKDMQNVSYDYLFDKYGASLTLFAQFSPNTYYVKYEKGLSDTNAKAPSNSKHVFDSNVTLAKNTFIGKSYKLSFDSNLPLKYNGKITDSIIENLPDTITGNLEFDKWQVSSSNNPGLYADNVNLGVKNFESIDTAVSIASAFYKDKTITFSNPSLPGYIFDGYFDEKVGGNLYDKANNTSSVKITPSVNGQDDTLHAHWTANTYYVVYKNYDGKGNDFTQTCRYDMLYNYLENPDDLDDRIFIGWYSTPNPANLSDGLIPGNSEFINLTTIQKETIYVYGKWSKTNLEVAGDIDTPTESKPVFIKTDQIRIDGSNIYKDPTRDKTYFIKNDTLFNLSFNGLIDSDIDINFLPMITNTNIFAVNNTETNIKNNEFIFDKALQINPENNIEDFEFTNNFSAIRKNNSMPNTNKTLLNYKQGYMLKSEKDGILFEIIPHSNTILTRSNENGSYETTYSTNSNDDKNNNVFVECDSTTVTIINDSIYDTDSANYNPLISSKTDIVIKYADFISNVNPENPKYGSGVDTKNIKLTITQEQNDDNEQLISKVYTDSSVQDFLEIKANDLYSGTITLHIDPDKFSDMSGFVNIKLEITDNVGNLVTKEYRILIMDFEAKIINNAPGVRNQSNVFAQGENGKIQVETNGFIEKINFVFPSVLDDLASKEKSSGNDTLWETGRILSDTYPRDKDGNIVTVLPQMQTKLWGTTHLGGMQWNGSGFEHSYLTHYFYAPLYSTDGKYPVTITVYKTDPLNSEKVYKVTKTFNIYIGINPDEEGEEITPITEEFRDIIKDN